MSVSKHRRFEVFKRDDFTCQYCGRKPPQAVLEADHIVPRAEGGGDETENLITACFDCNRGKGAAPLETRSANVELRQRAALIAEREDQLREYNQVLAERRQRIDDDVEILIAYWDSLAVAAHDDVARNQFKPAMLARYLETFAPTEIEEAMRIGFNRKGDWLGVPYTIGILRNWRDQGRRSG